MSDTEPTRNAEDVPIERRADDVLRDILYYDPQTDPADLLSRAYNEITRLLAENLEYFDLIQTLQVENEELRHSDGTPRATDGINK